MDKTDDRLVLALGDNMQKATLRIAAATAIAAVIATVARFLS